MVSFVELRHCHGSPRRLVAVICCDEPKLAAKHSAFGIGHVERRLKADLHILAEFLAGPVNGAEIPNRISLSVTPRTVLLTLLSWPDGFEIGESAAC
ncbi:MAG TPA: hypothetical protein VGI40_17580 [Pirellulaceae bacterium]